jgi:hypothetical protein
VFELLFDPESPRLNSETSAVIAVEQTEMRRAGREAGRARELPNYACTTTKHLVGIEMHHAIQQKIITSRCLYSKL